MLVSNPIRQPFVVAGFLLLLTIYNLVTAQAGQDTTLFTWSGDGQMLAISTTQAIHIYHIDQADPKVVIPDQVSVQELAFNHDGSLLASVDSNLIVHIWDTETGQSITSRGFGSYGRVERFYFYPDEDVLTLSFFAGFTNGGPPLPAGIWFWEYITDAEPGVIPTSEYFPETLLTFNHDQTLAVTAQRDSQQGSGLPIARMIVREVMRGEVMHRLFAVRPAFTELMFSPVDPDLFLSLDTRGVVRFWNAREGIELFALTLLRDLVTTATFTIDGVMVATGGSDGKVRLWQVADGALLEVFDNQPESIQQLRFTAEGDILALVSTDQHIEIWDVRSRQIITSLEIEMMPTED